MKIAIIQKCPSKTEYQKLFMLQNHEVEVYNLSSTKVSRLLKRDIDLTDFDPTKFDYVILVGSEALKNYTKQTSVTDYTGKQVEGKCGYPNFIASISPAMLAFKPENKPVFDLTVKAIHNIFGGVEEDMANKNYEFYRETEDIKKFLRRVEAHGTDVVALDSETSALEPREGYMLGISVTYELHQGAYLDSDGLDQECVDILQRIINTKDVVFHNAKFDMKWFLYHLGVRFDHREGHVHDTMILHYLLDERQGTHGLKSLALKYTDLGAYDDELDEWKKDYIKQYSIDPDTFSYDLIPWDIIKVYAAKDTDATFQLFRKFYPILIKNNKLKYCYEELQLPALHFLTRMEDRGVPVSANRLLEANNYLDSQLSAYRKQLWEVEEVMELEQEQGAVFNPNSVQQIRKLLFDKVGLKPTGKLTGTGAISVDKEVLDTLAAQHKVPKLIKNIRTHLKLKSTYISKLIPCINSDSRVRTGFHQTTTTSGRLSSSGRFNMQQLPRDNPIIKGCVVPPEGYKIVALDLTTAEIYFAAVLSEDKAMQQVFINMKKDPDKYPDFHSNIAHMVFNLPCEPKDVKDLYPALRQAAKAISFGILYGSGPAKVAEAVNLAFLENDQPATCTVEDAKGYIQDYFRRFKQLKRWIDECHNQIKEHGFIYNHFGRKRRLRNINSKDRGIASGEVRSGFNAIIQSISSDSLLLGAIDADKEIIEKGFPAEIFALVHDSIVAIVREDKVEEYIELVTRNVQKDRGCSIPDCPVGLEADSEPGGSRDYSCGKLEAKYPDLAKVA